MLPRAPTAVADCYLKINQPPFLLALDLYAEVDVGSAAVTVDHDARLITCVLRKASLGAWPAATHAAASPQALRERREASLARKAALDEQVRGCPLGAEARGHAAPLTPAPPPTPRQPHRRRA